MGLAAVAPAWAVPPAPPTPFTDPNSGIEFVRIDHASNPAYDGFDPFGNRVRGRGSVSYEYSIGKYEVTSGQWAEFFDAALNRADGPIPWVTAPFTTGGTANPMLPTGGITWRTAAVYCNWLTNNKSLDRSAFMNGAYDVSTFGYVGQTFTDQFTHNEGATYWIPTWDEWLKAAHYDPWRDNGDGTTGGWWQYSTSSDVAPIYGPPPGFVNGSPLNQANAGFLAANLSDQFRIPLGAYDVTSPWGLYDTAGATIEWTE
ncbi:MAG: SUMF1/EgtB/PvdO family nonheme iron enzyme [Phycisphaerales bacterium]|nr:MAG: SUMF1/EgtB/PvdO family nonheme iron enzyme [Phycisphaerales bacterium]